MSRYPTRVIDGSSTRMNMLVALQKNFKNFFLKNNKIMTVFRLIFTFNVLFMGTM